MIINHISYLTDISYVKLSNSFATDIDIHSPIEINLLSIFIASIDICIYGNRLVVNVIDGVSYI